MDAPTKERLAQAVDKLTARGVRPQRLVLHPDTARAAGLSATRIDMSSASWSQDADQVAGELLSDAYDLGRPKTEDSARQLGAQRCQARLRREVDLEVVLDPSAAPGALRVEGSAPVTEEA